MCEVYQLSYAAQVLDLLDRHDFGRVVNTSPVNHVYNLYFVDIQNLSRYSFPSAFADLSVKSDISASLAIKTCSNLQFN